MAWGHVTATSTAALAGRRRDGGERSGRWKREAAATGGSESSPNQPESNPKTGPLAWIRGGFPHPPIYGQIVSFDKDY